MKTNLLQRSILSFSASALLVSGLNGLSITSASLDLETYSKLKVVFDIPIGDTNLTAFRTDILDGNITIQNDTTDDNISISLDGNESNTTFYFSIPDAEDINVIRGNSYNNLVFHMNDSILDDSNTSTDTNLTKTLGTLTVIDDRWNLITIPAGVSTNAKEMIKSGKATMIWGWEYNSSDEYNWEAYPPKMEAGKGYWVRTRITANTNGSLGNIVASDYNTTLVSDVNISLEINASNFADVISNIPFKDEWVLLGNSGADATIIGTSGSEDNASTYFFEDLLNSTENCYFVSIYHWDASSTGVWINDTEGGATSNSIPQNSGVWVKQRLCDN